MNFELIIVTLMNCCNIFKTFFYTTKTPHFLNPKPSTLQAQVPNPIPKPGYGDAECDAAGREVTANSTPSTQTLYLNPQIFKP